MTGCSLITGLYQNVRKHLWKSHESYGIHLKKDQRGKENGKINLKKPVLGNKGLSRKNKLLHHKACSPAPFPLIHVI